MTERYVSSKRARAYERKFDYDEARRRHNAGESYPQIAQAFGVSKEAVRRACLRKDESRRLKPGEVITAVWRDNRYDRCPTCQGRKMVTSRLCFECHVDHRLGLVELVPLEGRRRVPLISVRLGAVVRYRGDWAVVERYEQDSNSTFRVLEYWDGPRERVAGSVLVDVAASVGVVTEEAA